MRKSRYTDEQIAYALRQAESGVAVLEVCRKLGVTEQTFYRWKRRFAGMGVTELRKHRSLYPIWGLSLSRRVWRRIGNVARSFS
jgi:putative transposase